MPFHHIDPSGASARALGILISPGPRPLVVLRPNGLPWDLLPAGWDGNPRTAPAFCDFGRDEASALARKLLQALEEAAATRDCPLETFGKPGAYQLWVRAAGYFWIVCRRLAGEPYRPLVCATREEAEAIGAQIESFVWPVADAGQEVYFNTQKIELPLIGKPTS